MFAGLKPGVASALIDLDADVSKLTASRSLDDAFILIGEEADDQSRGQVDPERGDDE